MRPQDPYALAKALRRAADGRRRPPLRPALPSLRPSWVQDARATTSATSDRRSGTRRLSPNLWSYIDVYDLADAIVLAVESDVPGHEVFYIASPDNAGGHDFAAELRRHYGDAIELRELDRPDASGISIRKARRLLGWEPTRSWRDYLDTDGRRLGTPAG